MNIDLPYTSVAECIEAGIARPAKPWKGAEFAKCSDDSCDATAPNSWIFNSQVFVFENGRLFVKPVTLWFPLCPSHAPLQDTEVIDVTAEPVDPALPPAKEH